MLASAGVWWCQLWPATCRLCYRRCLSHWCVIAIYLDRWDSSHHPSVSYCRPCLAGCWFHGGGSTACSDNITLNHCIPFLCVFLHFLLFVCFCTIRFLSVFLHCALFLCFYTVLCIVLLFLSPMLCSWQDVKSKC